MTKPPPSTIGADMQQATDSGTDYSQLTDPEFFATRRRVREALERLPAHHADRDSLTEAYNALTDEFTRRARSAWQAS
jgi:hypothetical protein